MKKIVVIITLIMYFAFNSFSQSIIKKDSSTTELAGVVMYFFNYFQGNKPDVGATIYIIPTYNLSDNILNSLRYFKSNYYFIPTYYKELYYTDLEDSDKNRINELSKKFPSIDNSIKNFIYSSKINELSEYIIKLNGTGVYSIQIKNGKYIMIIRSNNRFYLVDIKPFDKCISQYSGGLYINEFKISNDKYKNISCLFGESYSKDL